MILRIRTYRLFILAIMTMICQVCLSQNIFHKLKEFVNPQTDSIFIVEGSKNLIITPYSTSNSGSTSFWYNDTTNMTYYKYSVKSPIVLYVGLNVSYKGISFGYDFRPRHNRKSSHEYNYNFSVYGQRLGADFFLATTERSDVSDKNHIFKTINLTNCIKTSRMQASWYFVLHPDRFSLPAAITQSKKQIKSGGSPMFGMNVSNTLAILHTSQIPNDLDSLLSMPSTFKHFRMTFFGINGGYGFNWVTKHWLIHASTQLALPIYTMKRMVLLNDETINEEKRFSFTSKTRIGAICNIGKHHTIVMNMILHSNNIQEGEHNVTNTYIQAYLGYRWMYNK